MIQRIARIHFISLDDIFVARIAWVAEKLWNVLRSGEQLGELERDDPVHEAIVHGVEHVAAVRKLLQFLDAHSARLGVSDCATLVQTDDQQVKVLAALSGYRW